jgi:hypothetical protein
VGIGGELLQVVDAPLPAALMAFLRPRDEAFRRSNFWLDVDEQVLLNDVVRGGDWGRTT